MRAAASVALFATFLTSAPALLAPLSKSAKAEEAPAEIDRTAAPIAAASRLKPTSWMASAAPSVTAPIMVSMSEPSTSTSSNAPATPFATSPITRPNSDSGSNPGTVTFSTDPAAPRAALLRRSPTVSESGSTFFTDLAAPDEIPLMASSMPSRVIPLRPMLETAEPTAFFTASGMSSVSKPASSRALTAASETACIKATTSSVDRACREELDWVVIEPMEAATMESTTSLRPSVISVSSIPPRPV